MQVLGSFRLTDAAGAEIALPGKLDPALLAYLALNQGRRNPRSSLQTLLWAARADPPHSLSESLKNLRKVLGDTDGRVIAHKSDPVAMDFRAMAVDALMFEDLAKQDSREALEQAETIYGGELLEGFDIHTEEFEEWLAAERSRLRDRLVDVLSRLQRFRAETGETDKAIETAHRLLRLDGLHEESHRLLMLLHWREGRRSAALKAAQNCEETLRRENIEPEPETRRLLDEIRRSGEPPGLRPVRREAITLGPSDARPAETSLEPATLMPAVEAAAAHDTPQTVPWRILQHSAALRADTARVLDAAEDTARPVPASPAPQPRFELRVRLGRHWLSVTLGIIVLVLTPLGYYPWRYWNIPWLAPSLVNEFIVNVKALLPGQAPLRLAVLPFASSGGDAEAGTLAHGLSGDIAPALGRVSEIREFEVVSAASVPDDPSPDLRAIAREFKAQYLLLGSARQSGDQLRVQVQLMDPEGRPLWGKSYQGQTRDLFDLQDQITFDVINEVYDAVTASAMQRLTAIHGTRNLGAWLEANEGLKLLRHLTPDDNGRARLRYNRAIAVDPRYAGAYEGLAWTYLLDAEFGWSAATPQSLVEAQRLTQQAFDLDPTKPQLYSLRGHLNLLAAKLEQVQGNIDKAEKKFADAVADGEYAVENGRNNAEAPALLAFTLTYTGDPKRAIALVHRAIELSPKYPAWYGWALGRAYRLAGDPKRAVATFEASLPERPASIIPLVELVIAYGAAGDSGMAKAMAATIREKVPNFSIRAWAAIQPYEDPAMTEQDAAALRSAGLAD